MFSLATSISSVNTTDLGFVVGETITISDAQRDLVTPPESYANFVALNGSYKIKSIVEGYYYLECVPTQYSSSSSSSSNVNCLAGFATGIQRPFSAVVFNSSFPVPDGEQPFKIFDVANFSGNIWASKSGDYLQLDIIETGTAINIPFGTLFHFAFTQEITAPRNNFTPGENVPDIYRVVESFSATKGDQVTYSITASCAASTSVNNITTPSLTLSGFSQRSTAFGLKHCVDLTLNTTVTDSMYAVDPTAAFFIQYRVPCTNSIDPTQQGYSAWKYVYSGDYSATGQNKPRTFTTQLLLALAEDVECSDHHPSRAELGFLKSFHQLVD